MSSRTQKTNGYLIPDPITGYDLICVTLKIPDVREYRAALFGAVTELSKWWSWQRSGLPGDTRAKEAAAYWLNLIDQYLEMGECELPLDVRQNEENPCALEKTTDAGETWEQFADLQLCPPVLTLVNGVLYTGDPETGGTPVTQIIQNNPTVQPQPMPRGGSSDDNRCNAAANAVNALMSLHSTIKGAAESGAAIWTLVGLVIAAMAAFVFVPPAAPFLVAAITALLADFAVITTSYSDNDKQDLQCYLFNQATDAGGFVTFDYAGILGDLTGDSRASFHLLAAYVGLLGESGLNYAASSPYVSGAVCECEGWALQQLGGHGLSQMTIETGVTATGFPEQTGTYNATLDRVEGETTYASGQHETGCIVQLVLPSARTVTRIAYSWESDNGASGEIVTDFYMYDASDTQLYRVYSTTQTGGQNLEGLAVANVKRIWFYVRSYYGTITRINTFLVTGTGSNPFV